MLPNSKDAVPVQTVGKQMAQLQLEQQIPTACGCERSREYSLWALPWCDLNDRGEIKWSVCLIAFTTLQSFCAKSIVGERGRRKEERNRE